MKAVGSIRQSRKQFSNGETIAAPLSPVGTGTELLSLRLQSRLLWGFLVLGVLARSVRYFLRFPLWEDECFLCVNFIDRNYFELLQPLQYHQVAPILFLWIEATMVRLFGYSELVLRAFPFLCSLASLFLFRHLAGRLLLGSALVAAVGVFAVAYSGIRYAAEAKQYSSDLLVSLVILALAVEWWHRPHERRWLWLLTAFVPAAVGLSYPAVFVAGGTSLALTALIWRRRQPGDWIGWVSFNTALVGSFCVLLLASAKNQSGAELAFMRECWQDAFPPITAPLRLIGWLIVTHASDLMSYPVGGARGASTLALICSAAAMIMLIRNRRFQLMLLLLAPFVVHFAAAALQRYPYGGHVKFSQHLAPLICMMIGLGIAAIADWLVRKRRNGLLLLHGSLAFLACVAVGSICRDIAHPYKTKSDMRARAFARWFWFNAATEGLPLCVNNDLKMVFSPSTFSELSWSAMYLCNQRIYSPMAHGELGRSAFNQVSHDRPLRCVLYRDPQFEFDDEAYQAWLARMQQEFELVGRDVFPVTRFNKRENELIKVDYIETLTFIPRSERSFDRLSRSMSSQPPVN